MEVVSLPRDIHHARARAYRSECHGCRFKLAVACFFFEVKGLYTCPCCVSVLSAKPSMKRYLAALLKVGSTYDTVTLVEKISGTPSIGLNTLSDYYNDSGTSQGVKYLVRRLLHVICCLLLLLSAIASHVMCRPHPDSYRTAHTRRSRGAP